MKMLCLFFALSSSLAFAADAFDLPEGDLNPDTHDILIKKPEKYLRHDSMIYDFNTDLGIKDQRRYTGSDSNKIGLAGHISGDYEHFNNLLGYEFNYMHRSDRYNRLWYGFQLAQINTQFSTITQNVTTASGADVNADSNIKRPNDAKNYLTVGGLGVGYRFKLLLDFFPTEDVFESIDVYANYVLLNESFIKKVYKGYGLTTSYGIHKRSSTRFFYGGKFSYNLASVTRGSIGNESPSERSLSLGWLSLAFEMGFFF